MAFVRFRHDFIRYEFSSISLRHSSAHRSALLIAHDVHAGASSLYLSRVFGQLFLILLRPGFGLFDYVFEYLCDHSFSLSQCLHCRTSRFGDMHAMKGPYSSERSVALMIARELLKEIVKRDSNHRLPG